MHLSAKHPRARAQRIISYVLTAVFVAIGTVILTRYTQGFQIDPETRSLVQNGLVLIQTEPVDASITIDGQSSGKQTPNRVTLPVGEHSVELNAEGYRTWSKNFTVLGSDLIWLNYPLLVPTEVVTTNDSVLGVAPLIGASPDKRTLLSQTATAGNFLLFDIDEETTSEVVLAAPANVATALTDKTVQSISFGNNNRYALITAANDTATSFVYVDTERPEQSVVANELFEGEYTAMQLDSEDERNVYGLQNGILYRLNLDNQERSEALAENVLQFNSQAGFVSIIPNHSTRRRSVLAIWHTKLARRNITHRRSLATNAVCGCTQRVRRRRDCQCERRQQHNCLQPRNVAQHWHTAVAWCRQQRNGVFGQWSVFVGSNWGRRYNG